MVFVLFVSIILVQSRDLRLSICGQPTLQWSYSKIVGNNVVTNIFGRLFVRMSHRDFAQVYAGTIRAVLTT